MKLGEEKQTSNWLNYVRTGNKEKCSAEDVLYYGVKEKAEVHMIWNSIPVCFKSVGNEEGKCVSGKHKHCR